MRRFEVLELREAMAYADSGGQALHLHKIIGDKHKAPKCFVAAVKRGEFIAHLIDQDKTRLVAIVKKLGVNIIVVEREGTPSQHIDLCGGPLKKAIAMCEVLNVKEVENERNN